MVLKQDGSVWATGCNGAGQLGYGDLIHQESLVEVVASGQLRAILDNLHPQTKYRVPHEHMH